MGWTFSQFGEQLGRGSGIGELMDDLGHALAVGGDEVCMLGGGQPAHLPELDAVWRRRCQELLDEPGRFEAVVGNYEPPLGNQSFRESIAELLKRRYGWDLSFKNVAVTAGGQTGLFFLFNALAGPSVGAAPRQVLLPLVPEYIGYANQSVSGSLFRSVRPQLELIGDHQFKYRVDFEAIEVDDRLGAICVSRPTNPTGNVLTDLEVDHLHEVASTAGVPLIIDQAYGSPFPDVVFREIRPRWDEQMILTLSLSKLGLPGTRTAVVIARPDIIQAMGSMNSIVGLANSNLGQAIVKPMLDSGEVCQLTSQVIRPFYQQKSEFAQKCVREVFNNDLPYRIHLSEGAFFLWMWFDGLPIHSQELYRRLKERKVLVVPGQHFFFGLNEALRGDTENTMESNLKRQCTWKHREECIRVSFAMPDEVIQRGIEIIGEEIQRAYQSSSA